MTETVAHRIAAALKRHGVDVLFGQSLPSAVILACEAIGIRQLAYRQENMGSAMADGYARRSGRIGVVCAQNGPAATLLVPPLAEALKASIPIVALVQDVGRRQFDRNAFQELDHFALFSSCSKWTRRMMTPERVDDYVDQAFIAAGGGRPGPAVLLLPVDLLDEKAVTPRQERKVLSEPGRSTARAGDSEIAKAAALIAKARHPVVLAGGGTMAAGGAEALARLQEAAGLPVFTTNMGKGAVSEVHPLSCGVLASLTGPRSLGRHTRAMFAEADVVVLVGTRTNQNGTDNWRNMPRGAALIHLDIDPGEIGRNYEATVRLVGDAATTLDVLTKALSGLDLAQRGAARPALEGRIKAAWEAFERDRNPVVMRNSGPIRPERIMVELQPLLTPRTTVVADASYSSMWIVGQLKALVAGMRFLTPRGMAGLGWGLPMAIGAKVAAPQDPVVALVGDGGFAHSWAELETLVRSKIPLVVILLNNGVLGYQKDGETVVFGTYTTACHFAPVDHAAIARACGCRAAHVTDPADLRAVLSEALGSTEPWLIEVATDPDAHPPLSLYDGTLDRDVVLESASA